MARAFIAVPLLLCLTGCELIRNILGIEDKQEQFTLAVATTGLGSVSRAPDRDRYDAGSEVLLTAVPQPGNTFSGWSGGVSGTQNPITVIVNSNVSVTAGFAPALRTLTVVKAGIAAGTVTGTGIDCGTDCSEQLGPGTVTLIATPATGASFGSWTGCDNVTGTSCTVDMTSDRTVTATFAFSLGAPQVTVPATSSNGSYQVTVKCVSALCSTTIVVQEAPTVAFTSPTQQTYPNSPDPLIISYSGRPAGTYCYRAAFSTPNWGNAACVTVTAPTTAVLRITNTSSYDMIDIRLNNVQKVEYPYGILAGQSVDFTFSASGTVSVALGNGFYDSDHSRDIWFTLTGTANVTLGQTTTVTFENPTIGELLGNFTTAKNWDGQYFDNSANSYFKRFRFTKATNGWQLYNSTGPCFGGSTCSFSQQSSGTVRLVSWPRYSSIVTFDFGPGTAPAHIMYPFGSFQYQNGPSSWSIIEYWRQ